MAPNLLAGWVVQRQSAGWILRGVGLWTQSSPLPQYGPALPRNDAASSCPLPWSGPRLTRSACMSPAAPIQPQTSWSGPMLPTYQIWPCATLIQLHVIGIIWHLGPCYLECKASQASVHFFSRGLAINAIIALHAAKLSDPWEALHMDDILLWAEGWAP